MYDVIVVGAGPAGMTAALYALRNGKSALVIEKGGIGGQITFSPKVENIPGFQSLSGNEFADKFMEQILAQGAELELDRVTGLEPFEADWKPAWKVKTEYGGAFESRAVVLALGVKHRMLGLPGESELVGEGISFCAVCDGAFYAGKRVAVIGGGNSAIVEASLLAEICRDVTLIQNLPSLTGEKSSAEALLSRPNVGVYYSSVVAGYRSKDGQLTGIRIRNVD
ncbi:MAG: FAD-dependent oxidoreductase, partial [Firmicutes bacterium]|nr:FAD-dependent oxidoreductase [Bacillota bacterium]